MSKLNTYELIAIEWLQENIASVLEDDPDVGIFANPELADIFRQCISFIEDQETIQFLQEENERLMEGLHQIRILEDSYDSDENVLRQIFDIVYKLESEVEHDQAAR